MLPGNVPYPLRLLTLASLPLSKFLEQGVAGRILPSARGPANEAHCSAGSSLHDLIELADRIEGRPYEHQLEKKCHKGVVFRPCS
jgi:hypothetical protein